METKGITREEILSKPAGREMDDLVATMVTRLDGKFSTDIAAAWQVVEKLRESLPVIRLSSGDIMGVLWQFHVADRYRDRSFYGDRDYFANAETPALAICRTALLACVEPKP